MEIKRNEEAIKYTKKQDFTAKSFSRPTLSTVEYSSGYLLFTSYSKIFSELIEYVCIDTRKSSASIRQKLYIIAKQQKRDEHGASFQTSPKINRMLITRLICIQRNFITPNQLASPIDRRFAHYKRFFFFSTTKYSLLVPK